MCIPMQRSCFVYQFIISTSSMVTPVSYFVALLITQIQIADLPRPLQSGFTLVGCDGNSDSPDPLSVYTVEPSNISQPSTGMAKLHIANDYLPGQIKIPWQVGLGRAWSNHIFCGGSVLNARWVLTAGHQRQNYAAEIIKGICGMQYKCRITSQAICDQELQGVFKRVNRPNFFHNTQLAVLGLNSITIQNTLKYRGACRTDSDASASKVKRPSDLYGQAHRLYA